MFQSKALWVVRSPAEHLSDAWLARKQITYQYLKQRAAQKAQNY